MPAAARVGDTHTCPLNEGGSPHVGGPIQAGGTVQIDGKPAATVGSQCACQGPPDSITSGSSTVFIGGKPAARVGDSTSHGGTIIAGSSVVIIGG